MSKRNYRSQAGDTIVEVLIAIGVVSIVLSGAFAVSNRSTRSTLDSQEHGQAQQFLQAQVELYRSYALVRADDDLPPVGTQFCMADANTLYSPINDTQNCNQAPNGDDAAVYRFNAKRGSSDLYTFAVDWDSVTGITASESFVYRVYAGQ